MAGKYGLEGEAFIASLLAPDHTRLEGAEDSLDW